MQNATLVSVVGNGFVATTSVTKTKKIVVEKVSTTATSSIKKPSPPPLKPQMSKNVLSIMELDELDDAGDGIDGIEKVVGTAATPPQNAQLTTSLFEVKSIVCCVLKKCDSKSPNHHSKNTNSSPSISRRSSLRSGSRLHFQKHFRKVGFTPTSSSVSTPLGASPSSKFWVGDGDDSSSDDEQPVCD